MGMTIDNLCKSCINLGCEFQSGIVRTECAFYMPPYIEPDNCGNYVVMQQTVEAIPKADYENRLKADMVAMLTEIQLEIEENQIIAPQDTFYDKKLDGQFNKGIFKASEIIQQKINKLKEQNE